MDNGSDSELTRALEVIQKHSAPVRNDSFDIGTPGQNNQSIQTSQDPIIEIITNPEKLNTVLNLTPRQLRNIRSILIAAGTGSAHKYLSNLIGDEPAAILGAGLSAYLVKRLVK